MEAVQAPFLMAAAVAAAGIAGGLAGSTLLRRRDATARRERLRKAADVRDAREGFAAVSGAEACARFRLPHLWPLHEPLQLKPPYGLWLQIMIKVICVHMHRLFQI